MTRHLAALLLMTVTLWPGRLAAQTPEEREAFRLYKESQSDLDAARWSEAIEKLDRAYRLFKMPHILVRKAEALYGLGQLEQALDVLRSVEQPDAKLKARISELVARITKDLAEPVEVEIQTNVSDAEVVVDQVEKFLAPCTLRLTRGRHHFEVRKGGYEPVVVERDIAGPETRTIRVTLREQRGRVVFATDLPSFDGVVVRFDNLELVPKGREDAPNRTEAMEVRAGVHSVLCAREGVTPYMRQIEVPADRTVEVVCLLQAPPSRPSRRTWAFVTLGTGAAMTAAGVGMVAWYYVKRGQNPGTDAAGNRYVFRDRHENIVGFTLMGLGVATAAASYFLFTSGSESAETAPKASFSVSPLSTGAVAVGTVAF